MISPYFKMFLLILLLVGCRENTEETEFIQTQSKTILHEAKGIEILFEVSTSDPEYLKIFPDGIIPWISIENANKELDRLIRKNEIVVSENTVDVTFDYPIHNPVTIELKSNKKSGFTRSELILKISDQYKRIYMEEETSAKEKTIPIDKREGSINRNETNGKYGIWGHDLKDLDLSEIIVHKRKGGKPRLELYIES